MTSLHSVSLFFSQLFLRNSTTTDELHALKMPDCAHFCPIRRFVQLTADVIPENWDAECNEA